jgi:hypothetical protein
MQDGKMGFKAGEMQDLLLSYTFSDMYLHWALKVIPLGPLAFLSFSFFCKVGWGNLCQEHYKSQVI